MMAGVRYSTGKRMWQKAAFYEGRCEGFHRQEDVGRRLPLMKVGVRDPTDRRSFGHLWKKGKHTFKTLNVLQL